MEGSQHRVPLSGHRRKVRTAPDRPMLISAQTRLLTMLRSALTPWQAAVEVGISESTVYVQPKNCRDRLGVASNEEVVRKAQDLA